MGPYVVKESEKLVAKLREGEPEGITLNRIAAEDDLLTFIRLIAPHRVLGVCHEELIRWWTREDAMSHQLLLYPRDHQKSAMVAYRVAWWITKHPDTRVLYISSTANLATKQLKFIKDIFESKIYRRYWPEMVNLEEGKREKWSATEISIDHPLRTEEGVRDPTIFTAGLTTNITGMHSDVSVFDDVVVPQNAYSREGRDLVENQASLLASIETADSLQWVVGTMYHPRDLYNKLIDMKEEIYDKTGELTSEESVYEVLRKEVEDSGDGSGEYLWPRQKRTYDTKYFGFNQKIIARKKAQYLDKTQFRAQYYNDPNDPEGSGIGRDQLNHYERRLLSRKDGTWFLKHTKLNVFASIDFAFSLRTAADFTAIVVIGIDHDHNIYVLDIARFKTDKVSEYFKHILALHQKWGFRKIRAEVTVAQQVIVRTLKDEFIKPHGLALSVDEFRPTRSMGNKQERIRAVLEPRYDNGQVWHYTGGHCQDLEEELAHEHSAHDDIKDALASVIEIAVAPSSRGVGLVRQKENVYHTRFGGLAR
jgi:hypothetical protein